MGTFRPDHIAGLLPEIEAYDAGLSRLASQFAREPGRRRLRLDDPPEFDDLPLVELEADAAINVCLAHSGAFLDMAERRHDPDGFLVVAILTQLLAAIEQPQHPDEQKASDFGIALADDLNERLDMLRTPP